MELMTHLEWWRGYYHFVRYHESLEVELAKPIERKGKQQVQRHRRRTPTLHRTTLGAVQVWRLG